jgi:hypothetical protein
MALFLAGGVSAQSPEVNFEISLTKRTFFLGEMIPVQLVFTSTRPDGFTADGRTQDRMGRLNWVDEYIVEPADLVADPLKGLPYAGGGLGGLSGGPAVLSPKPFVIERTLNEFVRFREPGAYRLHALTRRVRRIVEQPVSSPPSLPLMRRSEPLEVVSNVVQFEVLPAPAEWVNQQIAAAVETLDAPAAWNDGAARQRRIQAGNVLRYLDTPEAAATLARRMGEGNDVESFSFHLGVLGSAHRRQLLPLLEQRLLAPDQPVWDRYLNTIVELREAIGPPAERWKLRDEYVDRLIRSLSAKQPAAHAISVNTLFHLSSSIASSHHPWQWPVWRPMIVKQLIADFRNLPALAQSMLLQFDWEALKSPEMAPVLREIYANPPAPSRDPSIEDLALRGLDELAPAEARELILAEIRQPAKRLRFETLAMLPDENLPELDELFTSRLEKGQIDSLLIVRYATGDLVKRVQNAYLRHIQDLDRQKLPHCAEPLVFYFLKYDPEFGEREMRRDLSSPPGFPACLDLGHQFQRLGRYAMSPALERLAIEFLSSPFVPVKRGAAEILGKYGSAKAEQPLWDTLIYFHSWWKGREQELKQPVGNEGMQLERTLVAALSHAGAWELDASARSRLLTLCTSDECITEVHRLIGVAAGH